MKMKTSQLNPTPSRILGTLAKLVRLTEKEGVEWSHWQHLTNNVIARRNHAEYLKKGCPKIKNNSGVITYLGDHELAGLILGCNYITPEEMTNACGFSYTDEQLEHFADTLPDIETLCWYRANWYMVVAGPPTEANLIKILYFKKDRWFFEPTQIFAHNDKVKAGEWLAVRMEVYPGSFGKKWNEQQGLISGVEYVPNAAEVSYAIIAYYKTRGIHLLREKYVRTSSVNDEVGNHICVGGPYIGNPIYINSCGDFDRSDTLGILSARGNKP